MPDGAIVLCDGNTGELLVWKDGAISRFADMGGSPWGALLGSDGAVYVTQGGNVPGSPDQNAVPGIQRVNDDGSIEMLATSIAGRTLAGPNDLAFGPDGRLWFTESGTEQDDRFAEDERAVGALYVLEEIVLNEHATNCIFDGPALYVTATKVAEIHADQRTGSFWRVDTDASGGLPLLPGKL